MDDLLRRWFGGSSGGKHPLEAAEFNRLARPSNERRSSLARPGQPQSPRHHPQPGHPAGGGAKAQVAYRWNDPDQLAQGYIDDLKDASYGYLNYQIVERLEVDGFPSKKTVFATLTRLSTAPGTAANFISRTRSIIWRWCANSS